MSHRAPSPEVDLSGRMDAGEVQRLATRLRSSRLTLLSAEPGLDRTGLLMGGLLPLLRRRAADAVGDEDRETRVVIPFTDRRIRRPGRSVARIAERAVLFNVWGAAPIAALRTMILASLPADAATYARSARLAPMLGELTRRFDARFLVLLDGFEQFWHPALSLEAAEGFIDEFSEAVNLDGLRANFLLSIDDPGEPRLDALRRRIAGFDDSMLHLPGWRGVPTQAPAVEEATQVPSPAAPESRVTGPAIDGLSDASSAAALPLLQDAIAPPLRPLPAAVSPSTAPKKPRRPRPPRVPFVKPPPIDTEGVYAFIESTLSQTASRLAPWHDAEGMLTAPSAAPAANKVPPQAARGTHSKFESPPIEARRPAAPGSPSSVANSLKKPKRPIDKWLDAAFAWLRRRPE